MCGFSNDKYFIKTFRQLKGASQRKYFNNKAEN
jgi:YesN/AraC family two-component response regulator